MMSMINSLYSFQCLLSSFFPSGLGVGRCVSCGFDVVKKYKKMILFLLIG